MKYIKLKKKQEKKEEENTVETIVFASQKIQDVDRELIYRFNKEHKDCNIIIRDYSDKHEQFHLDIASGDIPDIINFNSEDPINLIEKGIFTDLSIFMETDPDVSKKDFYDRLIELLEMDQEKIYFLPPDFNIVALAGSKKDIGKRESWTLKKFETFCKEKKEEAWEFLRQYFLKDSKPSGNSSGFPVRKDVMEYREECAMAKKHI